MEETLNQNIGIKGSCAVVITTILQCQWFLIRSTVSDILKHLGNVNQFLKKDTKYVIRAYYSRCGVPSI